MPRLRRSSADREQSSVVRDGLSLSSHCRSINDRWRRSASDPLRDLRARLEDGAASRFETHRNAIEAEGKAQ
jgi:hypothetical protein